MNLKRLVAALIPAAVTVVILTTGQLMSVRFRVTYSDDPNTLDSATVNQGVEDLSRLEAALYAIDLIEQHPVFGSGIGTFAATNYKNTGNYVANHDTYLEILTGTGVVGFSLLAGILWALAAALTPPQRKSLGAVLGVTLAAVSYTHLDVYKRQFRFRSRVDRHARRQSGSASEPFPGHKSIPSA